MTVTEYNNSVDKHSDGVYRFILKNIRDEERARDIIQDSFEKLWINVENINAEKVKSYLYSTAYHRMIDIIRREKRKIDFEKRHNYHWKRYKLRQHWKSSEYHLSDLFEI